MVYCHVLEAYLLSERYKGNRDKMMVKIIYFYIPR